MAEQIRQLPATEKEVAILRATFKDNEYLLKLVRSVLLGFDIAEEDKKLIKGTFADESTREALRKKIYPVLSMDVPIGHTADFWMGIEKQVFGASPDLIRQIIESKSLLLRYFKIGFAR